MLNWWFIELKRVSFNSGFPSAKPPFYVKWEKEEARKKAAKISKHGGKQKLGT